VVLLHGFPEFWYSWRSQIEALSAAGWRVLAPDMRGYNLSDKPRGVRAYAIEHLVEDIAALIREEAGGAAHLVGHDWGGVVAWRLAALHPELINKLAILNAPHPAAYRQVLMTGVEQWLRSWYVLLFQVPWLAESLIKAGNFKLFERALRTQPTNPAAFTEEDIRRYKEAWSQPGAISAGLNYYRAAVRYSQAMYRSPQEIAAPTLVLWGERDPFLSRRLLNHFGPWVPNLRIEQLATSHWIQNDAPTQVNELLANFFRAE
jgi:pimeloyl-ACP methyl ester carboxylesterase